MEEIRPVHWVWRGRIRRACAVIVPCGRAVFAVCRRIGICGGWSVGRTLNGERTGPAVCFNCGGSRLRVAFRSSLNGPILSRMARCRAAPSVPLHTLYGKPANPAATRQPAVRNSHEFRYTRCVWPRASVGPIRQPGVRPFLPDRFGGFQALRLKHRISMGMTRSCVCVSCEWYAVSPAWRLFVHS